MHFVMTSWLLSQIWVTFNLNFFLFFFFPPLTQNKLSCRSFMTQCNFIFHALRSLKGRLNGAFLLFQFYTSQEWRACLSFFFFSSWEDMSAKKREGRGERQQKSSTVAGCIYIIGIHLERHHGGLMGMRIEVDYRDRTAPLREWNALFMLGFHLKKEKTHTSGKTYVYPRPYVARLSASGPSRWLKGLKRRLKW